MTEKLRKLTPYQHARLRTELYFGSRETVERSVVTFNGETLELRTFTWVPAMYTALRELIDNALDEIVAKGHGDTLRVTYDPETMEFSVEDNGRGIPIHEDPNLGKGPAASILLGETMTGRNFDEREEVAGLNGVGASIVNYTAEWFQLDIWRGGKHFRQKWQEGTYRGAEIHRTEGPSISKGAKDRSGTRIVYRPSKKVFQSMDLPIEFVRGRLWDIAVSNPDLKVYFNNERLLIKRTKDPVLGTYFANFQTSVVDIQTEGFHGRYYLVANFHREDEIIHSTVNNMPTFEGGPHVDGFRNILYKSIIAILEPQARKEKIFLKREDITRGLLIFNITKMKDPRFADQPKTRLTTKVETIIQKNFIESDVRSMIRRNPEWIEEVMNRCRLRHGKKEDDDAQKELKKVAKPIKLRDAVGKDRSKCILFIAEGDSAIANMSDARNVEIHGGLGLRGKILNVHSIKKSAVAANEVLRDIMLAVGLDLWKPAVRSALNYGSIYIATDEDEDGKNITALLVNFFYTFWPELFADPVNPFIYKFCTPFIIVEKGGTRKYIYANEYDDFHRNLSDYSGSKIIRLKGLGRLEVDHWRDALTNPLLVPIVDDGKLRDTLNMIFNQARGAADNRKEWLAND